MEWLRQVQLVAAVPMSREVDSVGPTVNGMGGAVQGGRPPRDGRREPRTLTVTVPTMREDVVLVVDPPEDA